jgi:ParB family chromosome partitioning protein
LKIKISDINIGPRFRKDLGDIGLLADSIRRHGLLHPVVITDKNDLICGRRRIAAYQKLCLEEIEASLVSLSHAQEAEADENIVRKAFTVEEIAQIDQFYRDKEESEAKQRQNAGTSLPSGNFPRGRSREKIAARVGVSGRTLEKIRVIREASLQNPTTYGQLWDKVGEGKLKIDKGYSLIKKFQRIKEAQKLAVSSLQLKSKFDLKLGRMQEVGLEIADNSIDLILTDPPYNEESIPLYGELAKLAQRVLKPGGSIITIIGHYALFKIAKQITDSSELEYHWQLVLKHNGHTAKMWKQRVWPKYKPMLWYFKRSGNGNGPTMYSDIEDLIESQPADKTMHQWEQSTIEAQHIIKPLTVEGQIVLDPFMGYATNGIAALELNRRFVGIEIDKEHYSTAYRRLHSSSTLN